ncbi:MAG: hypothetical protein JJ879_08590 [Sneathiella sp.]|nr:hypothetical protein [Sneathiella sp.]
MKLSTLFTTTLVLSSVATAAFAANPNGPKPKCPMGQIPVLENGSYHCEDLKVKAPSRPGVETQSAPAGRQTTIMKAKVVMPDYTILGAKRKMGTSNTFVVKVKNMGTKAAPQGTLFGQHFLANNQSWGADAIIPPLNPGQTSAVNITIPPENFTRGDRVLFTADYFKKLVESNENNNKYAMSYN